MGSFELQREGSKDVAQGHGGYMRFMDEISQGKVGETLMAMAGFREEDARRLLSKRGSGPGGQPLEDAFCSNWNSSSPHLACSRKASMSCRECNFVRYCSEECLKEHQKYHKELCCSSLLSNKSTPLSRRNDENLLPDMPESQALHLPTISNPPSPVFGLLHDLESLDFCSPSTSTSPSSTPSSSGMASRSSTGPCFASSPSVLLPDRLRFFFPYAFDLRNVLQTICQIPEDYRGHVTLFINSAKCILAVRDLLILELLRRYGSEGIDAAISIWYSSALTNAQTTMFTLAIRRILCSKVQIDCERVITCYKAGFVSSPTNSSLRVDFGTDATRLLLSMSNDLGGAYESRTQYWRREEENHEVKVMCALPAHLASWSRYYTQGLALPFGACDASFARPNWLRFSSSLNFVARYSNDVLCGWDIPQLIRSGEKHAASDMDIYGCLFFHVRDMMQTFLHRTRSCCIELRLTQFKPRTIAGILHKAGIKFHRIDACACAHECAHRDRMKLPESVDLLGKLLEKDVSPAWPSLLLTSILDWAKGPPARSVISDNFYVPETIAHPWDFYNTTAILTLFISPEFLNCYFDDFNTDYLLYLASLKVDEKAETIGLERKSAHRIVSRCCCTSSRSASNNIMEAVDLHVKDILFHQRFYFHVVFSGFTFLERFQEWGWLPALCLQTMEGEHTLSVEKEAAIHTGDVNSQTEQDFENSAIQSSDAELQRELDVGNNAMMEQSGLDPLQLDEPKDRRDAGDGADDQCDTQDEIGDSLDEALDRYNLQDAAANEPITSQQYTNLSNQWDSLGEVLDRGDPQDEASDRQNFLDEAAGESITRQQNDNLSSDSSNQVEVASMQEALNSDVSLLGIHMLAAAAAAADQQSATSSTSESAYDQNMASALQGLKSHAES